MSASISSASNAGAPDLALRGVLSPEAEFVLLSARTHLRGARAHSWRQLLRGEGQNARAGLLYGKTQPHPLDWDLVWELAQSHRVLGLLERHLNAQNWENVPSFVVRLLQSYAQGATVQSSALKHELAQVSFALENAGIPVVSFKGPTLAQTIYGNAILRPSGDLDLLVKRADVWKARDVLHALGYQSEVEIPQQQIEIHLRVDSVFNFFRPTAPALKTFLPSGFPVELHWAVTSPCLPFDLNFESVEPRLGWMNLSGVAGEKSRVRTLSAEDLCLILCVHGAKHLWERLIWICDLAQLLEVTPEFDWKRLLQDAQTRGVQRMTALGLILTRDVMGTVLPREVENWLSTQPQSLRLASQLKHSLFNAQGAAKNGQLAGHVLAADKLLLQTIDRPQARLGFAWHLLTAPTLSDRAALNLPPAFDFLWCVLRPARALQKRVGKLF